MISTIKAERDMNNQVILAVLDLRGRAGENEASKFSDNQFNAPVKLAFALTPFLSLSLVF